MAPAARILYRSARMRVVYQPADSDVLVYSFNGGAFTDGGLRFFGDTYFAKRNVAAIGFVDNNSTWFPGPDMEPALKAIRAAVPVGTFAKAITYGISMGAWGALKYSRMLGAHASLAFGPQWSIDPKLVGSFDDRFARFFNPRIHTGMEIVADDLCRRNYVFYDPLFYPDRHHVAQLRKLPNLHATVGTFLDHPGIAFFTQTRLIDHMFALAKQDNPDLLEFRRSIRAKRASSGKYWMTRADYLRRTRGPRYVNTVIRSYEGAITVIDPAADPAEALAPLVGLTRALLDAGRRAEAKTHLETLWGKFHAGATYRGLAGLYIRARDFDRARAIVERDLQRTPRSLELRLELAQTLVATRDLQQANTELDKVREQAGERPKIWHRLRWLYEQLGRHEDVAAADAVLAKMPPPKRPPGSEWRAPAARAAAADPPNASVRTDAPRAIRVAVGAATRAAGPPNAKRAAEGASRANVGPLRRVNGTPAPAALTKAAAGADAAPAPAKAIARARTSDGAV